jgi:hypothetical protein
LPLVSCCICALVAKHTHIWEWHYKLNENSYILKIAKSASVARNAEKRDDGEDRIRYWYKPDGAERVDGNDRIYFWLKPDGAEREGSERGLENPKENYRQ